MEEVKKKRGRPKHPKNVYKLTQIVWWNDPAGETSGKYIINELCDEWCVLWNGSSEAQVPYCEIRFLTPEEEQLSADSALLTHDSEGQPIPKHCFETLHDFPVDLGNAHETVKEYCEQDLNTQLGFPPEGGDIPIVPVKEMCERCRNMVDKTQPLVYKKKKQVIQMLVCPGCYTEMMKQMRPVGKPFVNQYPVPGRNESCPCGSSKKYKHCCLLKKNEISS
jgi:hypothetical protein